MDHEDGNDAVSTTPLPRPVNDNDNHAAAHQTPSPPHAQPPLIPPHWSHKRHESYISLDDGSPPHAPITLEDHTAEYSERSSSCWARGVTIEDYVLVSGGLTSAGNFVVFNCKIDTLDGGYIIIRKRYSEFYELRDKLLSTFPYAGRALPPLPPKSLIYRYRPQFLEKRRQGLAFFLNCLLLNPEFSSAPVTKDFIFA